MTYEVYGLRPSFYTRKAAAMLRARDFTEKCRKATAVLAGIGDIPGASPLSAVYRS